MLGLTGWSGGCRGLEVRGLAGRGIADWIVGAVGESRPFAGRCIGSVAAPCEGLRFFYWGWGAKPPNGGALRAGLKLIEGRAQESRWKPRWKSR